MTTEPSQPLASDDHRPEVRLREMGGTYPQGKGSAGRPDENPDDVRDRTARDTAKASKADKPKRTEPATPES